MENSSLIFESIIILLKYNIRFLLIANSSLYLLVTTNIIISIFVFFFQKKKKNADLRFRKLASEISIDPFISFRSGSNLKIINSSFNGDESRSLIDCEDSVLNLQNITVMSDKFRNEFILLIKKQFNNWKPPFFKILSS
jgi:hypothetical protein